MIEFHSIKTHNANMYFSTSSSNESENKKRNESEKILNAHHKIDKLNESDELNESNSLPKINTRVSFNLKNSIVLNEKKFEPKYSKSNQIESIRKNDQNDENNQSDKDNKDQYNSKTNNLPRIPSRFNRKRNDVLYRHLHKNRKLRHKFNKLSSIILTSLPLERRSGQNDHHLNNKMNDKIDYRNHQNKHQKNQKFQNSKNENLSSNPNSTDLLTDSLIKSHRKVKRRKTIHNQFASLSKGKRKASIKSSKNKFKSISKRDYPNEFPNQTGPPSNTIQYSLFLTPSLFAFTTFNGLTNQSSVSTLLNTTDYVGTTRNDNSPLSNDHRLDAFTALSLSPVNEASNFKKDNLSISTVRPNLTSLNQVKNEVENLEESLKFANRLMILIYIIILFSVVILLLRVIYIAILRKLSRPSHSTITQSQNSARHSSQLYTQNTFNQTHYSNYNQAGGNSNNSNINVSTYGGRSSEPNSISGCTATASFIGTLTGTLIAHNAQLNRNDVKTKKDNNFLDDKVIIIKKPANRSDSPASLNARPFSRQSGKFINADLNIISDEFSSSVYVNENESDLNRSA